MVPMLPVGQASLSRRSLSGGGSLSSTISARALLQGDNHAGQAEACPTESIGAHQLMHLRESPTKMADSLTQVKNLLGRSSL